MIPVPASTRVWLCARVPDDVDALKAMVRSARAELAAREADLRHRDLLIEKLRHQLAGLRRQRYGVSAESLDQLELALGDDRDRAGDGAAMRAPYGEVHAPAPRLARTPSP